MSDNKGSNRYRNAEHIDIVVFHHEFVYIFLEIRIPHTQREENQRVVVPRGLPDFISAKASPQVSTVIAISPGIWCLRKIRNDTISIR